jgi:hypothetical protein
LCMYIFVKFVFLCFLCFSLFVCLFVNYNGRQG